MRPPGSHHHISSDLALQTPVAEVFNQHFDEHRELLDKVQTACAGPLFRLVELSVESLRRGGKLMFFGNGGSAADAQHLATEFTVRFVHDRRPLAALALTTDTSTLTACGNDLGFERIFSRQIEAVGRRGDVAIGFSTSGNSPNVISALQMCREMGITPAAFSGKDGGKLNGLADPLLVVPAAATARIQEMHILLGHIYCAAIEREMGLV